MKTLMIALLILIPFNTSSAGLPGKIIFDVPDANQPPPSGAGNWCVPMSTVNIIDYWANVRCRAGAYMLLGPNPPEVVSEDIGWFCGTNGNGSPNRANLPANKWPGTLTQDIQPGVAEFIQWDFFHLYNNPNALLPGKTSADWILATDYAGGFAHYRNEIDAGRPAILCFSNWDIVLKDSIKDVSLQETVYLYVWADPIHDVPQLTDEIDEQWYPSENDPNAPGHAVTGYGYWENFDPLNSGTPQNWAIVRDNWLATPKAVAVPWNYWNATVTMDPGEYVLDIPFTTHPYQLDGLVTLYERLDARAFQLRNSTAAVYVRATDQQTLYVAIFNTKTTVSQIFEYRLCFDTLFDGGQSPQLDDKQIILRTDGSRSEFVGNGVTWSSVTPSGWNAAMKLPPFTGQFSIELEIDYAKLGLFRGYCDTLGFSIWEHETDVWSWPSASSETVPCTWGHLISTDCYTPVELTLFEAHVYFREVLLHWQTASESNNLGFEIQRAQQSTPFEKIGFVKGAGTTNVPQFYQWREEHLQPGEYAYRLKQIDTDGLFEYFDILEVKVAPPQEYVLSPNYPNPFNPKTNILFTVPEETFVTLKVFDRLGRELETLLQGKVSAGEHTVTFDASDLPSGIYVYQFQANGVREQKKMTVLH